MSASFANQNQLQFIRLSNLIWIDDHLSVQLVIDALLVSLHNRLLAIQLTVIFMSSAAGI